MVVLYSRWTGLTHPGSSLVSPASCLQPAAHEATPDLHFLAAPITMYYYYSLYSSTAEMCSPDMNGAAVR